MKRLIVVATAIILGLSTVLVVSAATPHEGLSVSPGYVSVSGDGPGGCGGHNAKGWTCNVTVKNTGTEKETWIAQVANADNPTSTTFTPDGGTLAPGKSVKVAVVTSDCTLESFAFTTFDENYGGAVLYNCG